MNRRAARAVVLGALVLALQGRPPVCAADLPVLKHTFIVIAHRGEHRSHPENTLEAIDGAIDAGADFVEMDVRRSQDGRYVLMHDSDVERMTDGHGRVADLTWAELSRLAVRGLGPPGARASRIPLFEEALARCHGRIDIYLDFKDGDPAQVTALIRKAGMERHVLVHDRASHAPAWRAAAPELPMILTPPDAATGDAQALRAFLEENRPEVIDDDWAGWTAEKVQMAEGLGARVWPNIEEQDEGPSQWARLAEKGIKGVQSDRPRQLIAWLIREQRR